MECTVHTKHIWQCPHGAVCGPQHVLGVPAQGAARRAGPRELCFHSNMNPGNPRRELPGLLKRALLWFHSTLWNPGEPRAWSCRACWSAHCSGSTALFGTLGNPAQGAARRAGARDALVPRLQDPRRQGAQRVWVRRRGAGRQHGRPRHQRHARPLHGTPA